MLPVKVNADCVIIKGSLRGKVGRVVAFDYTENEVKIALDDITYVVTGHENIEQSAN